MKTILISFIFLLSGASSALADVVTKCDVPQGYSYYFPSLVVPNKKAGWVQDGVTNGSYLVTRDADRQYDVIFTDAVDRTRSSREDGGKIIVLSESDNQLVLVVAYPEKNVETWYFKINPSGAGEVTVSQARYGRDQVINKHSLMRAICSR
ncbi:MAG TPA: hypothetical protein VKB81_04680 [Nitrospira sp.]|nr:hypothetical protein [Nitrospira sp.]